MPSPQGTIRFETDPGVQAQLDWKESIPFETKGGEKVEVNVAVLLLSYSRFRVYHMSVSKSQSVLLSFLTEAFDTIGGVPHEILTDNMKTVMDDIQTLCDRVNQSFHQGTGKVPVLALEKEKNSLHPLPAERIRSSYRIHHKLVKINASNMISYQSRQYSVPAGYQGKTVGIQVYDNHLYAYYNMELLVRHPIGEAILNYTEEHYRENLS